jgi:hypothetical protein
MQTLLVEHASCERRCQNCQRDFMVVGRRRDNRSLTPAVESVACPYCKDLRRAMLAADVEGPVSAVFRMEEWDGAHPTAPPMEGVELEAFEEHVMGLAEATASVPDGPIATHARALVTDGPRLLAELRRLRAETLRLRMENTQALERLRNLA